MRKNLIEVSSMLKEITISNFKSFNKEQTFTMEAAPKSEISEYYDEHTLKFQDEHLLKVSSFYGPNGGGKSNLLLAIYLLKQIAINGYRKGFKQANLSSFNPSIFSNSNTITFTSFFVNEKYEFGYSISFHFIDHEVVEAGYETIIEKEELSCRDLVTDVEETIYSRNGNYLESKVLGSLDIFKTRDLLSPTISVLSYVNANFYGFIRAYQNKSNLDERVFAVIDEFNSIIFLPNMSGIELSPLKIGYRKYKNPILNHKQTLINLMKNADLEIDDIEYQEDEDRIEIDFIINGKRLPLENNSKGTRKYFAYICRIIEASGNVIVADDFDANLHPKITRAIVEYFNSKNNKNNQFIFNSHDIVNMDNKLFRRDEIWFAYLDKDKSTIITPLSNIVDFQGKQIRKDAVYGKQYLEGKYGGDPFVEKGLKWGE